MKRNMELYIKKTFLQITAENITQSKQSSHTKRRLKLMTICIFIAASLRKGKDYCYNKFCCFH